MTTDYLYRGWKQILFDGQGDAPWKHKYPQWTSRQTAGDQAFGDGDIIKARTINANAPYNQDRDPIKMYKDPEDARDKHRDYVSIPCIPEMSPSVSEYVESSVSMPSEHMLSLLDPLPYSPASRGPCSV